MPLQKGFLKPLFKISEISKKRFWIGIGMGVLSAFFIYNFAVVLREFFRINVGMMTYFLWEWTVEDIRFYNWVFAIFSSLFGQSTCFEIWLNTPRMFRNKKESLRKRMIINDQRFFTWSFLNFFSRVAVVYGIAMSSMFTFLTFDLKDHAGYVFWMLITTYYLHQWLSFRLAYKKLWKFITLSTLSIIFISFILVLITLHNSSGFDENFKKNSKYNARNVDLPVSKSAVKIKQQSWVTEFPIVISGDISQDTNIYYELEKITLEELGWAIDDARLKKDSRVIPYMTIQLMPDSMVKMGLIMEIKMILSFYGAYKVLYGVYPLSNPYHIDGFPSQYGILRRLPPLNECQMAYIGNKYHNYNTEALYIMPPIIPRCIDINNPEKHKFFKVSITSEGDYIYKNKTVNLEYVSQQLYEHILLWKEKAFIVINVSPECTYASYIYLHDYISQTINDLRNEYSLLFFNMNYEEISRFQKKKINEKYPFRLFETDASKEYDPCCHNK